MTEALRYDGAMRKRVVATALLAGLFVVSNADDIIFSGTRLKLADGKYTAIEAAHLYRIGVDGANLQQITFGEDCDIDPCISKNGRRLLFWRRDRLDSVGGTCLCSAAFDGSDVKVLHKFTSEFISNPREIARSTVSNDGVYIGPRLKKRHRIADDPEAVFPEIPGIPSKEGGTSVPTNVGCLDDYTLVCNYWDFGNTSKLGIYSVTTQKTRRLKINKVVNGRKIEAAIFGSSQWFENPNGRRAFWIGRKREDILLQQVLRTEDGGGPKLYRIDATTGRIKSEVAGYFLEDADPSRSHFLTTTWKWGKGWLADGAVPYQKLVIWDSEFSHPKQLGLNLASCEGACFVPGPEVKR